MPVLQEALQVEPAPVATATPSRQARLHLRTSNQQPERGTEMLVTMMGSVYRVSKRNFKKWARDFQANDHPPDIGCLYGFKYIGTVDEEITDWSTDNANDYFEYGAGSKP